MLRVTKIDLDVSRQREALVIAPPDPRLATPSGHSGKGLRMAGTRPKRTVVRFKVEVGKQRHAQYPSFRFRAALVALN